MHILRPFDACISISYHAANSGALGLGLSFLCFLGWLLLPAQQAVEIWSTDEGMPPVRMAPAHQLDGANQFPGLRIDLAEVWQA